MIAKLLSIILVLCFCAGCSSSPRWKQDGKTQEETERDYKICYDLARDRDPGIDPPFFNVNLNSCMESKGYKQE
jgi:hypothetical protein